MQAILSDIHSNLEALEAVVEDITSKGIDLKDVINLGDIVGYGPNPKECIDICHRFGVNLVGNHDLAVVLEKSKSDYYSFNSAAREAIDWTIKRLKPKWHEFINWWKHKRWKFLESLSLYYRDDNGDVYVHGHPALLPEKGEKPDKKTLTNHMKYTTHHYLSKDNVEILQEMIRGIMELAKEKKSKEDTLSTLTNCVGDNKTLLKDYEERLNNLKKEIGIYAQQIKEIYRDLNHNSNLVIIKRSFNYIEEVCFNGHTHSPGIIEYSGKNYRFITPEELNEGCYEIKPDKKIIVNVGSVGQPRDGNEKACYVTYDKENRIIRFRRVIYDFMKTEKKINKIRCLCNSLGERLSIGR